MKTAKPELDSDAPLKERVAEYVRKTDYVTFAELGSRFGAAFFDGEYAMLARPNIVFWAGMSEEAVTAISELKKEGVIHFQPTQAITYLIDGRSLSFPIVKQARDYKKPHWLPVTIRPGRESKGPAK